MSKIPRYRNYHCMNIAPITPNPYGIIFHMGMDSENKQITAMRDDQARPVTTTGDTGQQRKILIGVIVAVVVMLAILIAGVIILAQPSTDTARIRDIFIIFMALESLLLGAALIILIIQIARLTNLLQNEVKPILESTNETINTLRGTTEFLSENLVEPVIKLNQYVAALQQLLGIINLGRKKEKANNK